MKPIGTLQKVDLREYWKDEARDFTPWLAQDENLQLLGNAIELDLELRGTEVFIGNYKADIVAEDLNSNYQVIIENQLEKTNHDHLGKIITYASGIGANIVIWVSPRLTDEHRKAIDWLNEITDEEHAFFALEIELWRIDDSLPAPKFNVHCSPNDWAKLAKTPTSSKVISKTKELQLSFWVALRDYFEEEGTILNLRKPNPRHWYNIAIGRSKFNISLTVHTRLARLGCELYIRGDKANEAFFLLKEQQEAIEQELGTKLDWQELPDGQDCRIILYSDGDMGNSEVGHNALGCGRVFSQGAKLVSNSIATGHLYQGETWLKLTKQVKDNDSTLHFIGLLSDGNVHSHIDHLEHMVRTAKEQGVKSVRIHALLDGRDVGATSALDYFEPFEKFLAELSDDSFDAKIASGGGRMVLTMDRYDANWNMVKIGWETHVLGIGQVFPSAVDAINMLREETNAIDQDLPAFVVADEDGAPVGTIEDGDSVIFFNFRGDRSLEISKAFEEGDSFDKFDRVRVPNVEYAGMMEYDGDLHIPSQFLVNPPEITRTMSEYLSHNKVRQYAISETQKYGHVTYFFNGNKSGKFDENYETFVEVPSDVIPFEQKPAMKCKEITDKVVEAIESGDYDFVRLNYPNGDMVGHTGVFDAVKVSMEAMDAQLQRLKDAVEKVGGVLILTADHGNADDMYEHNKKTGAVTMDGDHPKAKTSHSLNPVPCIIYDPTFNGEYKKELKEGLGISSLTATCINFLGLEAPEDYDETILNF